MAKNLVVLLIVVLSAGWAHAENWPRFRGPTGEGLSAETGLPLEWGPSSNVRWRTPIPGIGWSSPVVWVDRIFVTSTTEEGAAAAQTCAIGLLAQLKAACGGDLDRLVRAVKLTGFVNSTPDFTQQPQVINGCSDFLVEALGEAGRHSRSAVSAGALPLGVAVEIEGIFQIK